MIPMSVIALAAAAVSDNPLKDAVYWYFSRSRQLSMSTGLVSTQSSSSQLPRIAKSSTIIWSNSWTGTLLMHLDKQIHSVYSAVCWCRLRSECILHFGYGLCWFIFAAPPLVLITNHHLRNPRNHAPTSLSLSCVRCYLLLLHETYSICFNPSSRRHVLCYTVQSF